MWQLSPVGQPPPLWPLLSHTLLNKKQVRPE